MWAGAAGQPDWFWMGSHESQRRYFRRNAVFSHGQRQIAGFYDDSGQVILAERRHGETQWRLAQTGLQGRPRMRIMSSVWRWTVRGNCIWPGITMDNL